MPIFAQPYPEGSDVFTDRAIGPQTEPAKKILVVTSWGGPLQTTGTSPSNRFSKGCIDWGLTATTMEATAASPAAPLAAGRDRRREEQGHCCQRSLTGARQDFLRGGGRGIRCWPVPASTWCSDAWPDEFVPVALHQIQENLVRQWQTQILEDSEGAWLGRGRTVTSTSGKPSDVEAVRSSARGEDPRLLA